MSRRPPAAALSSLLLAVALLPAPAAAQGWLTQTYTTSATLAADAETLAHPDRARLTLVLPADVPAAEVCVDAGGSRGQERGRTRVRAVVSRAGERGEEVALRTLEFEWRESDPPLGRSRCQEAGSLLAGDLVDFRFRFYDMPPLELQRRGRRIRTLPVLIVTGWVRHDPFTG